MNENDMNFLIRTICNKLIQLERKDCILSQTRQKSSPVQVMQACVTTTLSQNELNKTVKNQTACIKQFEFLHESFTPSVVTKPEMFCPNDWKILQWK